MPNQHGQMRSNSGVILNGQYEIQIQIPSTTRPFFASGCGAIFGQKDLTRTTSAGPRQMADVRHYIPLPRLDRYGQVLEKPRVTLVWMGKRHDDVQIGAPNTPTPS